MAVFAFIVGFHLLLVYGLVSGLARKVVEVVAPPLVTDIIEEIKPEDKPPPPPPPQMERPPVQVPPPDVVIDIPMETTTTAISNVTDKPAPPPPPVAAPVARTPAKIGRMPSSEDYYPAASKRAEEQGAVTLRVCVDEKNKIIGDPKVVTSSGFERLDEGAIKLARAGRYTAASVGGQPAPESCVSFRVKFEIK